MKIQNRIITTNRRKHIRGVRIGARGLGGMTVFSSDGNYITVPSLDSAYGRTVLIHELLHAKHSKSTNSRHAKLHPEAGQCAEDIRIQSLYWPKTTERQSRDAIATALIDIRNCRTNADWRDPCWIKIALRSLTILQTYYGRSGLNSISRGTMADFRDECSAKILRFKELNSALAIISKLGARTKKSIAAEKLISEIFEQLETMPEAEPPVEIMRDETNLDGGRKCRFMVLAMTEKCRESKRDMPLVVPRQHGSRIVVKRLIKSLVTGKLQPLYNRSMPKPAWNGTIMIDASGSMNATYSNVAKLCAILPSATVYVYCGHDHGNGVIAKIAENGKRARDLTSIPHIGCSNEVDDYALKLLLRSKGKLVLISDLGFTCPDAAKWEREAMQFLCDGRIEIMNSFAVAFNHYDKGGA